MRIHTWLGCLLAVGAFLGSETLDAQEAGLRHGGFGAPVVKLTEVDGKFGVLLGGRGGWIIDQSVVIGGGGYGLANRGSFEGIENDAGDPGGLEMAYGGLEVAYLHRPRGPVHFSLGMLVGWGGVTWTPDGPSGTSVDDAFFVVEPEVDVVLNATRVFQIALGASYRLARGVELFELRDADLSGLAGVVAIRFGSF